MRKQPHHYLISCVLNSSNVKLSSKRSEIIKANIYFNHHKSEQKHIHHHHVSRTQFSDERHKYNVE